MNDDEAIEQPAVLRTGAHSATGAPVAEWILFRDPRDAHHAAAYALLHRDTGCRLVKVWMAMGECAGNGVWEWWVIHPGGIKSGRVCVALTAQCDEDDVVLLIQSAREAARRITMNDER